MTGLAGRLWRRLRHGNTKQANVHMFQITSLRVSSFELTRGCDGPHKAAMRIGEKMILDLGGPTLGVGEVPG